LLSPDRRFAPDLIAFHQPDHPAAEEYHRLAAAVRPGPSAGAAQVLLCAALAAEAGASSVVLNLAISLARRGVRVAVLDAQSAVPAVADRLGLRGRPGLAEVLAGLESLDGALQATGLEKLTALAAGEGGLARSLCAVGETIRPVLRQLRDRFDVVLIDGPPLGEGDGAGLAAACDALYVVLRQNEAETTATEGRIAGLLRQGLPLRGCIVTGQG
jgi:Mrp family chromosome partitioning ATPase